MGRIVVATLAVAATLTGCGDDASPSFGDLATGDDVSSGDAVEGDVSSDEPEPDPVTDTDAGGGLAETNFVVVVDGMELTVDTDRGGYCEIQDGTETGGNISAGGFDDESGTRVELALRYQIAETTASGEDEYYGSLFVASSPVAWSSSSTEPWPFAIVDPAAGSLTMDNDDGQPVEVSFEIECGSADAGAPGDDASSGDNGDLAAAGDITQAECDVLWDLFHAVGGAQLPPAQLRELLDSLPARGPADLADDLQALADTWRPALGMLEELGVETAEDVANLSADDLQRVEEAAAPFNSPELNDVKTRIDAFIGRGCSGG